MRLVKCDRCGSIVDEKDGGSVDFYFADIEHDSTSAVLYKRHSVDLCSECQRFVYLSITNKEKYKCTIK